MFADINLFISDENISELFQQMNKELTFVSQFSLILIKQMDYFSSYF